MSGTVLKTAGHAAPSPAQRSRRSSQSSAIHRQTARSRIVELGWELAAKGSFLGTDGDLDIVTGRRVPKSTVLQERRAEQEGREEMAHLQRMQVGLEKQLAVPYMDADERNFQTAARALQQRLVRGVMAEMEQEQTSLGDRYSEASTRKLAAGGLVLTDLQATQTSSSIFSAPIWQFSVRPDSEQAQQPAARSDEPGTGGEGVPQHERASGEASTSQAAQAARDRDLPYHRFAGRDNVILAALDQRLKKKDSDYAPVDDQPMTVLEVRRDAIKIVVSKAQSRILEGMQRRGVRWRIDEAVSTTVTERQIQAISLLDRPWGAEIDRQKVEQQARRRRTSSRLSNDGDLGAGEVPTRQHGATHSHQWAPCERRVRQILLGHPQAARLAKLPPEWVSDREWRQDLRQQIKSVTAKRGLNASQTEAIALAMVSSVTLWQGPPGTGKTKTLHALLEALSNCAASPQRSEAMGQLLACADTNAATDNIVEGLVRAGLSVVRLGQAAKVRENVRGYTVEGLARESRKGKEALQLQEEQEADRDKLIARIGQWRQESGHDSDIQAANVRVRQCDATIKSAKRLMEEAEEDAIKASQVVCVTLSGAGDQRLGSTRFKIVILDEASQATEPSTLIPLVRGAECVVIAGDPQQLPPTVSAPQAVAAQLDRTVFERLQACGLQPWLLDTQYRMHPAIAEFPSRLFYKGRIQTGLSAEERPLPPGLPWPNPDCPVIMVECEDGQEEKAQSGNVGLAGSSFFNRAEALLTLRALTGLMNARPQDRSEGADFAAILTPYSAQLRLINSLVRRVPDSEQVTVSTVDGYQGREADVVIFSAVRNNEEGSIGFVADPRRLNVAITRPRRGLIVVGSPRTLVEDPSWRAWIAWVRDHGGFLTPNALPQLSSEQEARLLNQVNKPIRSRSKSMRR